MSHVRIRWRCPKLHAGKGAKSPGKRNHRLRFNGIAPCRTLGLRSPRSNALFDDEGNRQLRFVIENGSLERGGRTLFEMICCHVSTIGEHGKVGVGSLWRLCGPRAYDSNSASSSKLADFSDGIGFGAIPFKKGGSFGGGKIAIGQGSFASGQGFHHLQRRVGEIGGGVGSRAHESSWMNGIPTPGALCFRYGLFGARHRFPGTHGSNDWSRGGWTLQNWCRFVDRGKLGAIRGWNRYFR